MPLTNPQIEELADAIEQNLDDNTLLLYATDLGINLASLTVGVGTLRQRAVAFIMHMNGQMPPRDAELLEMIRTRGNAPMQTVAAKLTTPAYFSPTNDPHDAIILGQVAFIARPDLRSKLRAFTTGVNQSTTRMLVVRGGVPGGKWFTWEFLRHLAFASVGAQPFRHRLKGKGEQYTPRQLFADVFQLLDLDASALPVLTDNPQLARADAFVSTFKGKIVGLKRRCWLVIDDLNEPSVTPAIREAAFAIAQSAEEVKPQYPGWRCSATTSGSWIRIFALSRRTTPSIRARPSWPSTCARSLTRAPTRLRRRERARSPICSSRSASPSIRRR